MNKKKAIFIWSIAKKSHDIVIWKFELFFYAFDWDVENDDEIDEKSSIIDHVKRDVRIE